MKSIFRPRISFLKKKKKPKSSAFIIRRTSCPRVAYIKNKFQIQLSYEPFWFFFIAIGYISRLLFYPLDGGQAETDWKRCEWNPLFRADNTRAVAYSTNRRPVSVNIMEYNKRTVYKILYTYIYNIKRRAIIIGT